MQTVDFIKQVFLIQLTEMTLDKKSRASHPYIGFLLVCQAIEVLGACFDDYDWEESRLSELRFRLAVKKLFSHKYQEFNHKRSKHDLYKGLRCPMVHQMRPGINILLSERKNNRGNHLKKIDGKLLLVYEDFFGDFKNACRKLIKKIDKKTLLSEKAYKPNISVPSDYE